MKDETQNPLIQAYLDGQQDLLDMVQKRVAEVQKIMEIKAKESEVKV